MPTRGHEGHDPLRPADQGPHPVPHVRDPEHPGYEVEDVNVGGIVTFVAGLSGFLVIFFVFCFFMGKAINYALAKQDGPANKWHAGQGDLGQHRAWRRARRPDLQRSHGTAAACADDPELPNAASGDGRRQSGHCGPARARGSVAGLLQQLARPTGRHDSDSRCACHATHRAAGAARSQRQRHSPHR